MKYISIILLALILDSWIILSSINAGEIGWRLQETFLYISFQHLCEFIIIPKKLMNYYSCRISGIRTLVLTQHTAPEPSMASKPLWCHRRWIIVLNSWQTTWHGKLLTLIIFIKHSFTRYGEYYQAHLGLEVPGLPTGRVMAKNMLLHGLMKLPIIQYTLTFSYCFNQPLNLDTCGSQMYKRA